MGDVERAWEFMNLPDWASELVAIVSSGGKWPEGSESALWELADVWTALGEQLSEDATGLTGAAHTLLSGWQAPAAENFRQLGEQLVWRGEQSALPTIAQNAGAVSQQLVQFGRSVQYTKYTINIAFWIAVIELFAMVLAAFFTFGTSLVAAGPIAVTLRGAISIALRKLVTDALLSAGLRGVTKATIQQATVAAMRNISVRGVTREGVEELVEEVFIDVTAQAMQSGRTTPGGTPIAPSWNVDSTFASAIGGFSGGIAGGLAQPLVAPLGAVPGLGAPMRNMATNVIASPAGGLTATMAVNLANGRPLLEGAGDLFSPDALMGNALSALGRPSSHAAFDFSGDGMIADTGGRGVQLGSNLFGGPSIPDVPSAVTLPGSTAMPAPSGAHGTSGTSRTSGAAAPPAPSGATSVSAERTAESGTTPAGSETARSSPSNDSGASTPAGEPSTASVATTPDAGSTAPPTASAATTPDAESTASPAAPAPSDAAIPDVVSEVWADRVSPAATTESDSATREAAPSADPPAHPDLSSATTTRPESSSAADPAMTEQVVSPAEDRADPDLAVDGTVAAAPAVGPASLAGASATSTSSTPPSSAHQGPSTPAAARLAAASSSPADPSSLSGNSTTDPTAQIDARTGAETSFDPQAPSDTDTDTDARPGPDLQADASSGRPSEMTAASDPPSETAASTDPQSNGPVTGEPTGPAPDTAPVDPYIHAVESAAGMVTAQIDASGTSFESLTEKNFPKAAHPDQVLKSLAAAIDGGHQALIDRFLGVTPAPESRQRPPTFGTGSWIPSASQLSMLVTTVNGLLLPGAQLTLPTGDARAARIAVHAQIMALTSSEQAIVADAMVDNAFAQTTKKAQDLINKLRIVLQLTGLQLIADAANAGIVAADLEQPGRWAAHASEVGGDTRPSSRYQQTVTGGPKGIAYTVVSPDGRYPSDFDGIRLRDGGGFELLDSKGDYRRFVPGTGVQRLQGEAIRQILAADGRPIAWVSQFDGAQLAGLRGVVSFAISSTGVDRSTTPFDVTHETSRRPGDTPTLPERGPTPPSDAGLIATSSPTNSARDSDPGSDPVVPGSGHPVSDIRKSLVMNIPGTAFHGDAAGRSNAVAVTAAVAEALAETLHDSTRNRIADAAALQELESVDGTAFTATTMNGNDVEIAIVVGVTPTTQQGDSPLILIERTDDNPAGSAGRPTFTATVSSYALAEHVGQALADAIAQISALTDGHTTRESVLNKHVEVNGPLFADDFSVTDVGTVGAIRYLQHSIDATHGKHKQQGMHMRHVVNVLTHAGMMLTADEISTLRRPFQPESRTLPSLNRLIALPTDIHHLVLAANIDPDAKAISTGMPSRGVYLARGLLQHGAAGLASGITIALTGLAAGNAPLAAVRGATVLGGRLLGGIAQAQGERVQALRKAWAATHNKANAIVKGGHIERAAAAFLEEALHEQERLTGQPRHVDHTHSAGPRPRPDTPKVPSMLATAGRYGSAGLTSELVNVASFQAAAMANAALEQVLWQTVTGTPGALVGAVSTIIGEQFLLTRTEKQGGERKAADDAVEHDVAHSIRDLIDIAAAVHTVALDQRAQRINDLSTRAAAGESIGTEQLADIAQAPTFDQTLAEVTAGIQQSLAVGPDAEADLTALVEAAENAQTKLATVRRTPTPERLALHAKLVELGMEMPDTIYHAGPDTPPSTARVQEQASRAWVHKWLGLQTPDLADRLARMSLRPSAVASLGAFTIKGILAGGIGSGATMATFGIATGLDPAVVAVESIVSTLATGLVGGSMEHGVQTAAENRSHLTNPTRVHQSLGRIATFGPGIDITTSIIEHVEARQRRQIDELLGVDRQPDDSSEVGRNVRDDLMRVLFSTFGDPATPPTYTASSGLYGSRVFGSYSASSLSFAMLSGEVNNLPAGLISAATAGLGEGVIKHFGGRADGLRDAETTALTTEYTRTQAIQKLAVNRGEHIDDRPPNATFTPPPIQATPFGSDVVEARPHDPNRLDLGEVPSITTVTTDSMTITVDLANSRATIIDHHRPPTRVARVPHAEEAGPDPEANVPSGPTSPRERRQEAERRTHPPRRLANFVRGAQWREPWWRNDPLPPFVLPSIDTRLERESPHGPPASPRTPPPTPAPPAKPPTQPPFSNHNPPPAPTQPAWPTEPSPPGRPDGIQPPTSPLDCSPTTSPTLRGSRSQLPDGALCSAPCGGEHTNECGPAKQPAGATSLACAIGAAKAAARLMGLRLTELSAGILLLEGPDGSVIRFRIERFAGGDREALQVERNGDVVSVRVNSDAPVIDIALDVVSGVTAVGRFAMGATLEPSLFGEQRQQGGTRFSLSDFQHLARLELLLGYLGESCCLADGEILRRLIERELDEMGIARGAPHADDLRALLPEELRGTLLHELG